MAISVPYLVRVGWQKFALSLPSGQEVFFGSCIPSKRQKRGWISLNPCQVVRRWALGLLKLSEWVCFWLWGSQDSEPAFFFLKHIHFLPGPEPRCSGYVNPPSSHTASRASRELLVLGKSCQFELCSRMCPLYFSPGAKQILPGELKALASWGDVGQRWPGSQREVCRFKQSMASDLWSRRWTSSWKILGMTDRWRTSLYS